MAQKPRTPLEVGAALSIAALHTGITLWYRWPVLMGAYTRQSDARDAAELNRMVQEKATALSLGLIEAQAETLRLTTAAMLGRLAWPRAAHAALAIAEAGMRPALRTVKANAKRLPRRRS